MCGPSTRAYHSTIASVLCNATFHQRRDRGVAHYVRRDELRIEPDAHHRLAEWLTPPCAVASLCGDGKIQLSRVIQGGHPDTDAQS